METLESTIVFKTPYTCMLAGPSQLGKTSLLINILKHRDALIENPPTRIIYCYSVFQEAFRSLESINIEFIQGLPDLNEFNPVIHNMVIYMI
jgi:hypothetical protein